MVQLDEGKGIVTSQLTMAEEDKVYYDDPNAG